MEKKTIVILAVVVAIVAVAAAVALIRPATTQTSITDLTLCVELAENQSCIMPQTDFRPDVLIFYVFEYEDLSSSDNLEERWYLGEQIWTESILYTDHIIKQGGRSGRFASSGIMLSEGWIADVQSTGWTGPGRLELWENGKLARTAEFTVLATETLRDLHGPVTIQAQPPLVAHADMLMDFVPIPALKIPQEL